MTREPLSYLVSEMKHMSVNYMYEELPAGFLVLSENIYRYVFFNLVPHKQGSREWMRIAHIFCMTKVFDNCNTTEVQSVPWIGSFMILRMYLTVLCDILDNTSMMISDIFILFTGFLLFI